MQKQLMLLLISGALSCGAALTPHIGFVYPAGACPGETLTVTIGGQYLENTAGLHLSGASVQAGSFVYTYEIDPKAGNNLRNMKEKLEAALAEETDELKKSQLQYQLDQIAEKMDMMMTMRQESRKDPALAKKKQFNPQISERVQCQITIPENTPPGVHELRLVTTNGISNPLIFEVGLLPVTAEAEPNDDTDHSTAVRQMPAAVSGQIMPGDTDCFRFAAVKGQTLVFRAHARSLVPYLADAVPGWFQAVLTLYDSAGREVACNDDFYFDPDPVLIYEVPSDGDYILRINDSIYRGREDFVYRIEMGELPFVSHIFPLGGPEHSETAVQLYGVNLPRTRLTVKTGGSAPAVETIQVGSGALISNTRLFAVDTFREAREAEPNNLLSQSQTVTTPVIVNGRIDAPGDLDCFRFEGRWDEAVSIEAAARRIGSPLDARLVLLDAEEHVIASSDDVEDRSEGLVTHHADACIRTNLPAAGVYTVRLDDLQGKGGGEYAYRLHIGREQPDFSLRMTPASLRIPRNGTAVVTVHAIRKGGFSGPIQIRLVDAPRGLEISRDVIPEGADRAQIMVAASGRADRELFTLQLEGTAEIGSRTVTRRAVPAEDMMQAFIYRHLVPAQELLVMITEPEPVAVALDLPHSGVIEARPGETISLPATVIYNGDAKGYIQIEMSDPPEWITLKSKGISGPQPQKIQLAVSANAEVGDTATLLLKGKISIVKPETDPTYNPIVKWQNRQDVTVTIGAVPVKIVD